mmetsp:Transcript_28068/g.32341  ORF Transcript_28068/g.32341 Transcript_28068/m.32341 type:complete len:137 (-) Transcript_28068:429-839(-)
MTNVKNNASIQKEKKKKLLLRLLLTVSIGTLALIGADSLFTLPESVVNMLFLVPAIFFIAFQVYLCRVCYKRSRMTSEEQLQEKIEIEALMMKSTTQKKEVLKLYNTATPDPTNNMTLGQAFLIARVKFYNTAVTY